MVLQAAITSGLVGKGCYFIASLDDRLRECEIIVVAFSSSVG